MKKNHLHFTKSKLSVAAIIVVCICSLCGILMMLGGFLAGAFLLLPAIILIGIKEGVYIDTEKRMYKSYLSVFGITPAQWKPIPEGTRIGIRIVKLVADRRIGLIQLNSVAEGTTFELYLYFPQRAKVVLQLKNDVEKLYFEAQNLSNVLNGDVIVDQRIPEQMYLKTR